MGKSHPLIEKGFELAVDANFCDEDDVHDPKDINFDITMGTGFTGPTPCCVNVEINNLNIEELEEIANRLSDLVIDYKTRIRKKQ